MNKSIIILAVLLINQIAIADGAIFQSASNPFLNKEIFIVQNEADSGTFCALIYFQSENYSELVESYVNWKPSRVDEKNPFRKKILQEGRKIVPTIISMYQKQNLPLSIVWLLGELSDPETFDILFRDYLEQNSNNEANNYSYRIAISVGSCLSAVNIEKLFKLINETNIRKFSEIIYGAKAKEINNLELKELKIHMLNNITTIKQDCQNRSKPMEG